MAKAIISQKMKIQFMRNKIKIISLFVLLSCGQEVPRADQSFSNLGNILTISESDVLTSTEKSYLTTVCNSLSSKGNYLSNYIINNDFIVNINQSSSVCSATATKSDGEFKIESGNSSSLQFTSESANPLFKYVETANNGALSDFCKQLSGDEVKRFNLSGGIYKVLNIFNTRNSSCSGDSDTICAFVQYAFQTSDGKYKVEQIVKLNIDNNSNSTPRGIVERKEVVEVCSNDNEETSRKIMSISR